MALVQDQPEDLPTTNALADVVDPDDEQESGERAEIYLSGAHVATLDQAPHGLGRVTLMCGLEVVEESIRFTDDGEIPIRRCRRVGDMWIPGTPKPPTREEIAEQVKAAKAKAQAKQLAAERAEQEENEPPMFDDVGQPDRQRRPEAAGPVRRRGSEPRRRMGRRRSEAGRRHIRPGAGRSSSGRPAIPYPTRKAPCTTTQPTPAATSAPAVANRSTCSTAASASSKAKGSASRCASSARSATPASPPAACDAENHRGADALELERDSIAVCPGCGANLEALDRGDVEHRPDCTVEPSALICEDCDAIRLPSEP